MPIPASCRLPLRDEVFQQRLHEKRDAILLEGHIDVLSFPGLVAVSQGRENCDGGVAGRYGVLLRREDFMVNHKRVYRLYREEGLCMRPKKPRRHVSAQRREVRTTAVRPDERWSLDFMSDELVDRQRIRTLNDSRSLYP